MSPSSLRPYGRVAVGALVLGLVAAVPAAPAAARGARGGIAWAACGERLECAQVQVPLDWSKPRGRTITLAVARHLASDPAHRIGSLLVNPGGPGDSGITEVFSRGAQLDALTQGRFDVVGWDPRGSGSSTAAQSPGTSAPKKSRATRPRGRTEDEDMGPPGR